MTIHLQCLSVTTRFVTQQKHDTVTTGLRSTSIGLFTCTVPGLPRLPRRRKLLVMLFHDGGGGGGLWMAVKTPNGKTLWERPDDQMHEAVCSVPEHQR